MANFPYHLDKHLIIVPTILWGPHGRFYNADLIFDTGASLTIIDPIVLQRIGYSDSHQIGLSSVQSPVGKQKGFRLKLHFFECFGKKLENFEVACHDLGLEHISGLLGMNFLEQFDFCVFPKRQVISIS